MRCPYCQMGVYGVTGLTEAQNFQHHLNEVCTQSPGVVVLTDGRDTVAVPDREYSLQDALQIRAESGQ